ncbi:hypothetical protein GIB67_013858 [Kingdonia uniflora]|uniref:Cytochrome P450 n=1 Tax=Kingdonia uniflora TaxID=39325 RepID=A0A7J7KWB6_9MAGN|nr:hypothetical protein GIB67_013858 [Kingdonia uniflora]
MEFPLWFVYSSTWLLTLLLIVKGIQVRRRKLNQAPGPKPWPIIGNLNLIGSLPHRSIHDLSQKYGPLMQLKFGSYPVVVASSVETAKLFLKTHDITFAGRPKFAAGKYTTYNFSDITWSQYGPYWRQARKMCIMELFSTKRLESYEYIRVEEMRALVKGLYASSGSQIMLKDYLSDVSLNVISRIVLGKKYLDENETKSSVVTPEEFKKMLDELFLLNGVLNIGDSIPSLACFDLHGYVKRMKSLSKKFDRFLEYVIDEHNEKKNGVKEWVAKDMVDVLLQLADDPNLEVKLTRTSVKAFTQVGGGERHTLPTVYRSDCERNNETAPVAPMLVPRLVREDCKVAGYDIVAGTRALVSVWTIGRDPTLWDEPEVFRPERFVGKSMDVKGHDFELLPFGAGRRMCPGYTLGLKVIQSSLANLIHGFVWKLPEKITTGDLNMEEIFGLSTPRKIPLIVVLQPRLPAQAYFQ